MKTCSSCHVEKQLSDFPKDNRSRGLVATRSGQGVGSNCKLCRSEKRKPGLKAERDHKEALAAAGLKECGKCKEAKPFNGFHKRIASNDNLAYKCITCVNVDTENWRAKNPDAHAEWYAENKDHKSVYYKNWRSENKLHVAVSYAAWAKANAHKVRALVVKRRAAKLLAMPAWANHDAIAGMYAEAARLRCETGERYEVDHIVPLQGKTVRGLHWEGNLQILLKAENISKHNRRWPDMP